MASCDGIAIEFDLEAPIRMRFKCSCSIDLDAELAIGQIVACACGQRWRRGDIGHPLEKLAPETERADATADRIAALEATNADLSDRVRLLELGKRDETAGARSAKEWCRGQLDRAVRHG